MKLFALLWLTPMVGLGLATAATAQEKPVKPEIESARPYIEQTCTHLSSTNPRVRYAAREALRNFGTQAVPLIQAARKKSENPHVQAFIDRVLVRVRSSEWRGAGKTDLEASKNRKVAMKNRAPYDIDRIAMDINLTFEQIARLDPLLRRHVREVAALWAELRAAGALKEKEAYRDLDQEIELLVKKTEPKLRAFLDARQTEQVMRLLRRLGSSGTSRPDSRVPEHLQAWERDLTERWNNRANLTEDERKELMEEWRIFKERAYGK
jgi:hypothetical protein